MTVNPLPKHVAIIMDGNGRWAKKRLLPRAAGHHSGVDAARRIVKHAAKCGIQVLSLFAFSSENWQRPLKEVNFLMDLFLTGLEKEVTVLHANNIRLRFIGNRQKFNEKLRMKIDEVEQLTITNTGMMLLIAVDYGGQWDICQAVKHLAQQIQSHHLQPDDITPEKISKHLSFFDLPDPDLFIRTSGELRLSNFMLWQVAYSELYFSKTLWPDFNEHDFDQALMDFAKRDRRYGRALAEHGEEALC